MYCIWGEFIFNKNKNKKFKKRPTAKERVLYLTCFFFFPNSRLFFKLTLTSPKFWYWTPKIIFIYRLLFHESYFRSNNLMSKLLLSNFNTHSANIIEFAVDVGWMRMFHIGSNICIVVSNWWNCLGKYLEGVALFY